MPVAAWEPHLPPDMAADEVDLLARGTLPRAWAAVWARDPRAPVLHDHARGWITAAELEEATRRVAGRFVAVGLEPGDRVLFSASSSLELVIAHVAALRAGIVVVPMNTAYRAREVAHIVTDARPRAAVIDDRERAGWISAAAPDAEILIVGPEVQLPDGVPAQLDAAAPGQPALIGYTSGTTGRPKGAVLSHANLLAGRSRPNWPGGGRRATVSCTPCLSSMPTGCALDSTAPCWSAPRRCCSPGSTSTRFSTPSRLTRRPCSSGCRPCTTGSLSRRAPPNCAGCAFASPARRHCRPSCTERWPSELAAGARALRHDGDADARLESV